MRITAKGSSSQQLLYLRALAANFMMNGPQIARANYLIKRDWRTRETEVIGLVEYIARFLCFTERVTIAPRSNTERDAPWTGVHFSNNQLARCWPAPQQQLLQQRNLKNKSTQQNSSRRASRR